MPIVENTVYVCHIVLLIGIPVSLTLLQGYYDTMDSGFRDKNGYVAVMSRTDDVINVAGHRLSTGALEEVGYIKFSADKLLKWFSYFSLKHPTKWVFYSSGINLHEM